MRFTKNLRGPGVLLLAVSLQLGVTTPPAVGYDYDHCFGSKITWDSAWTILVPTTVSFPSGSAARSALEAALIAWNDAPGTNFEYFVAYDNATTWQHTDGKSSVAFTYDSFGDGAIARTKRANNCGDLTEVDVLFNSSLTWTYEIAPSTPVAGSPYNMTLVALHELGHAFGLNHQASALATMNAQYPAGGPIGNYNAMHPHADDVHGDRAGYGGFSARDVIASAYRSTGTTTTGSIPAPVGTISRGSSASFQFSIENRGTATESTRVQFYLSPDRFVTTADHYLGAAVYSLGPGVWLTQTATVTIPPSIPAGSYYFGWFVDPLGSIPEVDENNNGVGLYDPVSIPGNPVACFTAQPTSGATPLSVSFDASCSSDTGGSIVTYAWDFGDGSQGYGSNVSHWYYSPGYYTVSLTVTDDSGLSSPTTYQYIHAYNPACPTCLPE